MINHIFIQNVSANGVDGEPEDSGFKLLGTFRKILGRLATILSPVVQFFLIAAKADPVVIEIGYGETVTFDFGMIDLKTGEFEVFDAGEFTLFNDRFLNFEVLEYPGGNTDATWTVNFNPYTVPVLHGSVLKTNVSVSLRSSPDASNGIQSGLLKLRIKDTWANGDLWRPPKGSPYDNLVGKTMWFFGALLSYGKYSGTVDVTFMDVNVLVKVKPYHNVKLESVPTISFRPDAIASIPITIQNLGNYNDTFSFKVVSEHKDIKISDPISISLAPGETKDTYLGVAIPPDVFDYGTLHKINIETYSLAQPNVTIAERAVYLETKGIFLSEISVFGLTFLLIIVFLAVGLFSYRRRQLLNKYCVKPDKPWEIPEEKKYLEKLKQKDKEQYKEVLEMMEDEFESSLLWYNSYCESILKPEPKRIKKKKKMKRVKKVKPKKIKKVKVKKEKLKEEKPAKREEVKPEKPKVEEKKEEIIDKKAEAEKRRRERTLKKIKLDQEKQIRKFGK